MGRVCLDSGFPPMAAPDGRADFRYKWRMTRTGYFIGLLISVAIDALDMTIGRALFVIPWEEGVGALILFFL
jgi:hypothetical protein